jgi:small GTP-binding protein
VLDEIDATRSRSRIVYRDSIAVRHEGAAQIALVGPPNAGKSSLLHALSDVQIKIGNYAFTTLRPVPALVRIEGVLVQFVEIPGLLEGANDDHGGGRAYLGVLREADAIVYCQDATAATDHLRSVMSEVARAGIERPALLALTKFDDADAEAAERFSAAFPGLPVVTTSVLDDASLAHLKAAAWQLTGLIRVYVRDGGDPFALPTGSTLLDVAAAIHSDLVRGFRGARVWGPSARFAGQRVGRDHVVLEGDMVELLTS